MQPAPGSGLIAEQTHNDHGERHSGHYEGRDGKHGFMPCVGERRTRKRKGHCFQEPASNHGFAKKNSGYIRIVLFRLIEGNDQSRSGQKRNAEGCNPEPAMG